MLTYVLSLLTKKSPCTACSYQEKFYFSPGDTGFRVFDTAFGKIGVLICWDQVGGRLVLAGCSRC